MRTIRWLVWLSPLAVLSGCASLADVAGGVSAVASGAATGNPAVAIGVGGIVRGAVSAVEKAHARSAAADTQITIVDVASALEVGEQGPWREAHRFGSDATGRVEVTRVIYSPLAICKEIAFTLNDEETETGPYRAAICRTRQVWRWALAEPSTERWLNLR